MVTASAPNALSLNDQTFVDRMIASYAGSPGALLSILERTQEHHPQKFLPREILEYIGERMDIPLAQIYGVVTFYALFNLEPQGRAHHLHLPRNRLPHARIAQLAAALAPGIGTPR